MALVNVECSICGKNIDKSSKLDPCSIALYTNIDKDDSEQLEQIFFCHYECFLNTLDSEVRDHLQKTDI